MDEEADAVEAAVQKVLTEGYRTGDIMSEGCTLVGTKEMGRFDCSSNLKRIKERSTMRSDAIKRSTAGSASFPV